MKEIMELLIMIDAAKRASAHRINVVLPYFIYSRSDKKDQPRVPVTARLFAELLEAAGASRVITCDLHNPAIQAYFNIPCDKITGQHLLQKYFEGTHNFKSFTKTDEEKGDYVRTISQTNLIRDTKDINKITLVFVGTGFLRYMVRNMVGTLIAVGEGKLKSEDIIKILEKEDRREAMKTANPEGLYLKNVFY